MGSTTGRAGWLIGGLGFGVAAGVALGTLVLAPNMPEGSGRNTAELAAAEERADIAEAQASSADSVVGDLAAGAVHDTLGDRPVLVLRTADAAEEDVAGVATLLAQAGAVDAGTITLAEQFLTAQGADQLKSIVPTPCRPVRSSPRTASTRACTPGRHSVRRSCSPRNRVRSRPAPRNAACCCVPYGTPVSSTTRTGRSCRPRSPW